MELQQLPISIGASGVVREEAVDEMFASPDSVELAINLNFDSIGAATLRPGTTLLSTQIASGAILGMSNYRNNAGTIYRLLAKVADTVYSFDGGSWASVRTGLSATSKARFTNYLDLTYMVDGNAGSIVSTFDGSSFGASNVGSLPRSDYVENYRSRIWSASKATDKVYYTDVVSTSQTISGGTNFIQVSPQDGENITALKRHSRALLVFKQNHIYKIYSTTSADPDPSIFRGTYSQESIVEAKDGIYYHHPTGFYKFVFDGEQQEISRPIIDVVKAVSRANYENINGWSDDDHVYWSIGDIELKGVSYSNIVCRYTISTQVWTLYSYPSEFKNSALYDNGTLLRLIVGDENGNAFVFNEGLTDNTTSIFYEIETHPLYFSQIKTNEKLISEISVLHESAQTTEVFFDADDSGRKPVGNINDELSDCFSTKIKFEKVRLGFSGNSKGDPIKLRGWEITGLRINEK